jgi:acyl-CoA synthetase (AMP-forming)/AMP-acid ligase II
MTHPAVKLAYVVGVPDANRDEVIAAIIVPRAGCQVEQGELVAHCRRALASYKIPRLVKFLQENELPLTVTGKLQKNRLNEFFAPSPH